MDMRLTHENRARLLEKTNTIKLLDIVAITVDLPEHNLWRGQVGTVVEVEFSDREGHTYESLGLRPDQIMVLHYEPMIAK